MPRRRAPGQSKFRNLLLLSLFILTLLLAACDAASPTESINPAATATAAPTKIVLPTTPSPTPSPALTALPPATKTTSATSQDWQYRWLKGIPCQAPCWEGITPGKTSAEEAVKILQQSPILTCVRVAKPTSDKWGTIQWGYIYETNNSNPGLCIGGGEAHYSDLDPQKIIQDIAPYIHTNYKLTEVIAAYGNPDYVVATGQPDYDNVYKKVYSLSFFYLKNGFELRDTTPYREIPKLTEETHVTLASFFIAGPVSLVWPNAKLSDLTPWQGFKDFSYPFTGCF
jgi:hypothetical protein